MSSQLADRFLSRWPALHTPVTQMVHDMPVRQRRIFELGRNQIEVQRASAELIARSSIAGAQIIAAEIRQQTATLDESLQRFSSDISSSIMDAADQMQLSIELLGDRLCAYMGEIHWELAQHTRILEGILRTLQESRTNEARQLVEQGTRHLVNEQYDKAEERFRQALQQDTTDYQVLMNLGTIAVLHTGDSVQALQCFWDAVRLPSVLDKQARSRALLAIARVHYAEGDYARADAVGRQALAVAGALDDSDEFILATHAALAGATDYALERLKPIILRAPEFFARAATDPDLESARTAVLALLSDLSIGFVNELQGEISQITAGLNSVSDVGVTDLVTRTAEESAKISIAVDSSSYGDLQRLRQRAYEVRKVLGQIIEIQELNVRETSLASDLAGALRREQDAITSRRSIAPYDAGDERFLGVFRVIPSAEDARLRRNKYDAKVGEADRMVLEVTKTAISVKNAVEDLSHKREGLRRNALDILGSRQALIGRAPGAP